MSLEVTYWEVISLCSKVSSSPDKQELVFPVAHEDETEGSGVEVLTPFTFDIKENKTANCVEQLSLWLQLKNIFFPSMTKTKSKFTVKINVHEWVVDMTAEEDATAVSGLMTHDWQNGLSSFPTIIYKMIFMFCFVWPETKWLMP